MPGPPNFLFLGTPNANQGRREVPDTPRQMPADMVQLALLHLKSAGYPTDGVKLQRFDEPAGPLAGPLWKLSNLLLGNSRIAIAGQYNPATDTISYNPFFLPENDQPSVDDLIAHELTHRQQAMGRSLLDTLQNGVASALTPYRDRPDEQEAYGVMAQRRRLRQDIDIPSPQALALQKVVKPGAR